jgi:hypothetical protein
VRTGYGRYFAGQIATVFSMNIYYSLFPPAAEAAGGSAGLGAARAAYSLALVLLSPVAGCLVGRFAVRNLLAGSACLRLALWAALLPIGFHLFGGTGAFVPFFAASMFLDGAVVSVASLFDIDEAGIDLVASQYGLPVDDGIRNRLGARFEAAGNFTSIVMAPLAVFVASRTVRNADAAQLLLALICVCVAVPQGLSALIYARMPRPAPPSSGRLGPGEALRAFRQGMGLAFADRRVCWRIAFCSLERAASDVVQIVLVAEFGIRILARGDLVRGALATTGMIATIHLGGLGSAWFMHSRWRAPRPGDKLSSLRYRPFFRLAFASGAIVISFPVAAWFARRGAWGGCAIVAGTGCFLFGAGFTAVSLGFRNLMQGMVGGMNASAQVFGVAGACCMLASGLCVALASGLFALLDPISALWVSGAALFLFGAIEAGIAPKLVFGAAPWKGRPRLRVRTWAGAAS